MFEENQEVQDPNFGLGQIIDKYDSGSVVVLFDSQLGDYYPIKIIYDKTGKVICIVKGDDSIIVNNLYKKESLTTTGNIRHPHQIFYKRFCVFGKNGITVIDILEKIEGEKYYGRSGAVYDKFFRPLEYGDLKVII